MSRCSAVLLLLALFSTGAKAGLDHELALDQNGIWAPISVQLLPGGVSVGFL
jgi:hypothetical protein